MRADGVHQEETGAGQLMQSIYVQAINVPGEHITSEPLSFCLQLLPLEAFEWLTCVVSVGRRLA